MARGFSLADLEWALRGAEVGVWAWDIPEDRVQWSPEMGHIFNVSPEAFPTNAADYVRCLHPEDRAFVMSTLEDALKSRTTSFVVEHRVARPDGSVRWVHGTGRLELDERGVPVRLGGTATDITAHQEALAAVRKTAEQFRLFSELASDYVYVVEVEEGVPLAPAIVAGSFERTTGYTVGQVVDKGGWLNVIHPEDVNNLTETFASVKAGKPFINEYRIIRRDGETRWLHDHIRPVLQEGILVRLVGSVQDVTERKSLEEQLRHAQRMEALARLAAGVAHDFNNILQVVTASLSLMRDAIEHDVEAIALSAEIDDACVRAAELTRSLLAFGRNNPVSAEPISLGDALHGARSIIERAAGEKVTVILEIMESCGLVELDVGQLQLVLLNLTLNAKAAMPDGGKLRVSLRPRDNRDGPLVELETRPFVVLEVSDTGTGIPPEVLPHIFEPFFTTKDPSQGTGLGLASCYGIITQAGGALRVTSDLGRGTTFRAYLPTTTRVPKTSRRRHVHGTRGGTERVLFVEDDSIVRRLVSRILQVHGYQVSSTSTLEEARVLATSREYDVLVSDVRLPDGDGAAFAAEQRDKHPTLPVLLISGFADDQARATISARGFHLLAKPFGPEEIARSIRTVLDDA